MRKVNIDTIEKFMLSLLNFLIILKKSVSGSLLIGIVLGNGRKEANNLTSYLNILIKEHLVLSECYIFHPTYMKVSAVAACFKFFGNYQNSAAYKGWWYWDMSVFRKRKVLLFFFEEENIYRWQKVTRTRR